MHGARPFSDTWPRGQISERKKDERCKAFGVIVVVALIFYMNLPKCVKVNGCVFFQFRIIYLNK